MPEFAKQCQSCGMPLENGKNSGSESDGTKSLKYCAMCYDKGSFLQPDITLDEMKLIIDKAMKEKHFIWPMRWMAKMQLPSLERWKRK